MNAVKAVGVVMSVCVGCHAWKIENKEQETSASATDSTERTTGDVSTEKGTDFGEIEEMETDTLISDSEMDERCDTESETAAIGVDTGTTDSVPLDTETQKDSCSCEGNRTCNTETNECVCKAGYVGVRCLECDVENDFIEWPEASGDCIPNPCAGVDCIGQETCIINEDLSTTCECPDGWRGEGCDLKWRNFGLPPMINGAAVDSDGNGWFSTDRGLLYWDFKGTPDDTGDDEWTLYTWDNRWDNATTGVAIDTSGRKWVTTSNSITVIDDANTPADPSDDVRYEVPLPRNCYNMVHRLKTDPEGRVWVTLTEDGSLSVADADAVVNDVEGAVWTTLLENRPVHDFAPESNGVWISDEEGLHFLDLGEDLADVGDDEQVDFEPEGGLGEGRIDRLSIDADGLKWFCGEAGIVRLNDNGDPLDKSKHDWFPWIPASKPDASLPGVLLGIGPDNAKWFGTVFGVALRLNETMSAEIWTEYNPSSVPAYRLPDRSGIFNDHVYDIVFEDTHLKWVNAGMKLYLFDDGDTPFEGGDDLWYLIRTLPPRQEVASLQKEPMGGVWLSVVTRGMSPDSDEYALYYFDPRNLLDVYDDVWLTVTPTARTSGRKLVLRVDEEGRKWFGLDQSIRSGEFNIEILDDAKTPQDPDDDTWYRYAYEEGLPRFSYYFSIDPTGGFWTSEVYVDNGGTLDDKTDDKWLEIDPYPSVAVAFEDDGGKWFGYIANDETKSPLRYFDNGDTPTDLTDDIWSDFTTADGVPSNSVIDIGIDGFGEKWIRVGDSYQADRGIGRFDDNNTPTDKSDDRWTHLTVSDGLPSDSIESIVIDTSDNLWIATQKGISYLYVDREP